MEISLFELMGGTYHQESGYFLPDLFPPESISVGIWGQRRKHYLKTKREPIYTALLLSGELDSHLSEVDTRAETMFFQLVKRLAEREGYAIISCDEFSCPIKFTNRDTINWTFRGKNRTIGLEHKEVHYDRINVYESGRLLHSRSDT